jgi:DNA-binding MarR family transcriptional regulator
MGVALLLPEAQAELITLVHDSPAIRVNEAASRLGVAANTVSTLVGRLVAGGLLERTADPSDARGGCLRLTATAESRVASWRGHRAAVIEEALSRLDIADSAAIEAALPALWRLGGLLDVLDDG